MGDARHPKKRRGEVPFRQRQGRFELRAAAGGPGEGAPALHLAGQAHYSVSSEQMGMCGSLEDIHLEVP
eukprot:CAMPEP_0173405302 /NCGR_PEP_ID=MMETSP1356-20130122/61522_1 /TAXON_ID=77927 ORGANISM="Hemiselmis virescens, Strain PCC157" /NCGR_SAMPLE_ID=MMETSP1356 /ASSEMBLY_ACC=CAM_ASM_000847 /LENGTH=68 /DNA_ID=CAMNT_0014366089 /DNA_START=293 /DNA_END=496 /DNA_ORIENTATION=+